MTTSGSRWYIRRLLSLLAATPLAAQCIPAPRSLSEWFSFDEAMFEQATRVKGKVGGALRFDGVRQYFEVPARKGLAVGAGDFTVELWVRTAESKTIRNIADYRDPKPRGWLLYIRSGAPGFQVADGSHISDTVAPGHRIADGRWHHIVAVARRLPPQPATIFVDGQRAAQTGKNVTLSNLDHQTPLWFARHHRNSYVDRENVYFAGEIDEFSLYRRALDDAEIAALYRAGSAGKCRP